MVNSSPKRVESVGDVARTRLTFERDRARDAALASAMGAATAA